MLSRDVILARLAYCAAVTVETPSVRMWQDRPEIGRARRRTLAVLVAAQVVGGLGIGAGVAMGSLVAEEVAGNEALAGIARTMSTLGTAAFAVPLVLLAGRAGRRGALTTGWLLSAIGAVLLVTSVVTTSLPLVMLGMVVFGAGQAANLQSRFAAADLAPPRTRARLLSVVVWATTVGTVLGPNLAGPGAAFAEQVGLPAITGAYAIGAVGLVLGAVVTWFGLRPDPLLLAQQHTDVDTARRSRSNLGALLARIWRLPLLRTAMLAVVLNQTVMVTVMTMAPVHMAHHDLTLPMIGLSLSLHTLGMFAFSPVVGWLADRWGEPRTILVGAGISLVSLVFCFLAGDSMLLITVGLFLLGLGWSFGMVAGSALLTHAAPDEIRTRVQGVGDTAMNLVAALGAAAAGPVLALWGYSWLAVIAAVVVVVMVVLIATVPRALPVE